MMRVKTGVPELDEMLHGGFVRGDSVLVAGSAGTGKTTLAMQHLVNGITKFQENGVYVTFEELPDQIHRDASNFGWDLKKMEAEDKLRLVCTTPNLLVESGAGENILDSFIKEVQPSRIVIDSLSHISMFVKESEFRKEIYRLVMYLKTKGLSSLLLWEAPQLFGQFSSITDTGTSFLVDSIVLLKPVEVESTMRKALVILKMRGSDHDKRLREFEITSEGIKLAAPFAEYEGVMTGSARRVSRMGEAVDRFSQAFAGQKTKRK